MEKDLKDKKILLIEDDPFLIDIYTKEFENSRIEIQVIRDGLEALKFLKENKVDLILLDILLPRFSGWQILEEIKKIPEIKDTKVIILSNLSNKEDIEKAFSLGIEKYLVKAHFLPKEVVKETLDLL
ncbi:MAG: response regulator [Minisyncoccia bacterium]